MKTLEEIKESYADARGFDSWDDYKNVSPVDESVFDKIAEAYADQFKPKWIPVEERLPRTEKSGWVNVIVKDGGKYFVMSLPSATPGIMLRDPSGTAVITHWMPLPAAPDKEEVQNV